PHVSSGVRSAGCNLIATLVFGMSETIAITGKSVKLFKGHYTRSKHLCQPGGFPVLKRSGRKTADRSPATAEAWPPGRRAARSQAAVQKAQRLTRRGEIDRAQRIGQEIDGDEDIYDLR
ncbi:MAG: hypothetical protein ACREYE_31205, partial [Gammaproteobacteria bacterium]